MKKGLKNRKLFFSIPQLKNIAIACIMFAVTTATAQCPAGDVILTTQAQVDQFIITYPTCTVISGHLRIDSGVVNLNGLSNITAINGSLDAGNARTLTNISGLSNLTTIGQDAQFINTSLTNLGGLSSLTSVAGYLSIRDNAALANINGLSNLTSIAGLLNIRDNAALANVNGLSNLVSIGGYAQVFNNSALTNLDGLSSLTSVVGALNIRGNAALANVNGLSNLASVGGILNITDNAVLANVNGLSHLINIGGALQIGNNTSLTNLDGLSSLTSIAGFLSIIDNALTSVNGLRNINPASIVSGLNIKDNPALAVCNLPNFCTYLANPAGTHPRDISGNATNCISEQAVITACQTPATCPAGGVVLSTQAEVNAFGVNYPNCTHISGHLQIGVSVQNAPGDITNLYPLANITTVDGNLYIQNSSDLQNVDGLNIETVGGWLYIGGDNTTSTNLKLTNINGLSSLTSVAKDIYISYNTVLTDISALQNTTFAPENGYGLTIINNPQLSVCNLPNFCTYLANPAGTHPRDISGNATNCISEQAVTAACQTPTPCPTGDVTLATQAEVNAFGTTYSTCNAISGNLFIGVNSGSSDITDLSPLAGVQSVSGYVWLANNSVMQNLNGLHNISNIGGALNVTVNAALQNLNGLSSLATVGQDIYVVQNPVLTNISALQNTTFTPASGFGLTLKENTLLEVCNYPNFCAYIANDATTHPRVIADNATTCATEQALQAACQTIGINDIDQITLNAYPNPTNDNLYVEADKTINIQVVDLLGKTVQTAQLSIGKNMLDVSKLNTGIYFIQSAAGQSLKFIKQ